MQGFIKKTGFFLLLFCIFMGNQTKAMAGSKLGGAFSLTDHNGRFFELKQLHGKVVLLFFGYTSCPDVCPNELSKMAQVLRKFENTKEKVTGLFVTIDPERDTPRRLKEYISYFSKHLLGLTGTSAQIEQVAKLYRANFKITENNNSTVDVDHSSNLYVIDRKGEVDTMVPFGMGAGHIVKVVEWLLKN